MKRVFSFLLVLLMLVGLVPLQSFAASGPWNVWAYYGDYEYVTVSHTQAYSDETVTVTPLTGYRLSKLEVYMGEAEQVPATYNGTSGSFTMPDSPVEIWVEVESTSGGGAPHSINLLSAGGGTPTADKYTATAGQTVTITPNPDTGNVFTNIQIDYYRTDGHNEIYYLSDGVTSFVMPDDIETGGVVKVTVYYERDPNAGPVTTPLEVWCYFYPTSGAGTVTAPETATPGDTVTFTVLPNEGYKADVTVWNAANTSISIDYTRISQTEYQFTMPEDIPYIFVMFTEGEDDYVPGGSGGNEGGSGEGGGGGTPEEGVYNISVKENAFATIEVQKTAEAYDYVDVSITPVAGYRVSNFTVWTLPDYGPVDEYSTFSGEYYFLMPESDVLVAAYVWPLDGTVEYTITNTTDSPNGTATTPAKSAAGVTIPITTTPAEGYEVDTITVVDTEGTPVTVTGNKFVMPDDNVTVNVTFKAINSGSDNNPPAKYNITTQAENGTVTTYVNKTAVTQAAEDEEVTVTATPADGYELDTLTVKDGNDNDITVTGGQFTMPASDVMVTATFKAIEYNVSVTTPENGAASAPAKAKPGDTVTVTTEPDEGFVLDQITVTDSNGQPVTVTDGQFTMPESDATVTVTFKAIEYNVSVTTPENGTASAPAKAKPGDTVTVTTEPDEGYVLDQITVIGGNGQPVTVTDGQFTMPESGVTVTVTFKAAPQPEPEEYPITVTDPENGAASAPAKGKPGDTVTVITEPDEGFVLDQITVIDGNGQSVTVTDGKFTMPESGVTVTVTFKAAPQPQPEEYPITVTDPENGTASAPAQAKPGDTVTVTTEPDEGYVLDQITVIDGNGQPVTVTDGQFTMPESGVTVTVTFKAEPQPEPEEYPITVTDPENGTASATAKGKPGDTVTITTEPDEGFVLDQITVIDGNGQPVTVTDGQFTMPESGVTVTVTFKAVEYNVVVTTPENGTLSANPTKAQKGDTVTVTATPVEGYKLIRVTVTDDNDNEITVSVDNTFAMPECDVTVAATFALDQKIQVSFDPNSGSCGTPSSELDPGSSLDNIPSADREDYLFLGWYTEDGTPVTDDTVFTESTTVYARWAAHTTDPQSNAFGADIAMDDLDILKMLVTDEELKSGLDVVVYMTVDEKSPSAVPTADYNAINSVAGTDRIGAYLDIQLFKQIGNDTPFNIHNTKDNLVPITVQLPDTVIPQNAVRDSFYIIYHHVEDGETITATVPATFDVASKTLSFSASRFSTYALAYTTYDVRFDANGGAGTMETQHIPAGNFTLPTCSFTAPSGKEFVGWKIGSVVKKPGDKITLNTDITITAVWKNKTSGGTLDSVPKTGDTSGLAMWTLLILCSTTMLAGVAVCDKRRAR